MQSRPAPAEVGLALVFAALGILWIVTGLRLPMWEGFAPQSGFLPVIYGFLLTALALVVLVGLFFGLATAASEQPLRKPLLIILALVACVVGLEPAGFITSIFLLLAFLFVVVERLAPVKSLIVAGISTACLVLIFKTWLGVPFPVGPLGI
jgi:uncharacterized membrane protein